MDAIQKSMLEKIADLHEVPEGAYNIRSNGALAGRNTTANIDIVTKQDKPGIDIIIKPGTKNESVHIPVILSESGLNDCVYNDFYIGEGADVVIVAGCGIHNCGTDTSEHDGIHTFFIGKNAKVKYIEKHYGEGDGTGEKILNPTTIVHLDGVDSSANVISRSVAKDSSKQVFNSKICGNNKCYGHTECDAILMDNGHVNAVPSLEANDLDASLIHEAAIGKIAGEQLIKLMTLGLTEHEAEEQIIK